jgi:hypothetical protein
MTEAYYKVDSLAALAAFTATLDPVESAADLFVYDGRHGPLGAAQLASTVLEGTVPKLAAGAVPLAGGPLYLTVEGWMISSPPYEGRLTSGGTDFSLRITSP